MSTQTTDTQLFGANIRDALVTSKFGNRRFVPCGAATEAEFTLHDTFDMELANSQRLLVAVGSDLWLLQENGPELAQPAAPPGFAVQMPDGPVKEILCAATDPLRTLLSLGGGTLTEQHLALIDDEHKTRVRCHLRLLSTPEGQHLTLLRLEGLRGYDRDFERLTHGVQAIGVPSLTPKAALDSLFPGATDYTPKPTIGFAKGSTAFDAACAIVAAHLPVARANEPGVIADHDSEFLHDYRIALRKIRSVVSLFKGVYSPEQADALKARFSALMAVTGPLRDLDVYLIERPTYLGMVPADLRPGVDLLFDRFARKRRTAQRALIRHLQSDAYAAEIAGLEKLFAKPRKRLDPGPEADHAVKDYAQFLIRKRYRKVRKIALGIDAGTPDEEVHELRIQCKKLRYLMEFFAPLFGTRDMKRLIKSMKRLQDNLGMFNDSVVQQESLAAVMTSLRGGTPEEQLEIARSVGALMTVLHQRQDAERARVMQTFAQFDAPDTRQGFKALFATGGQKT